MAEIIIRFREDEDWDVSQDAREVEEQPEQARVPELVLLVGVVGQHEALRHPDDAGAGPQQDGGAVEHDGGGEEELEAVEDVEGGSQHEAGGGAGEDQERGGGPGEDGHHAVHHGQAEDSSLGVLEAGEGVEASEQQHEAHSEHTDIEQSGRVRHPPLTDCLAGGAVTVTRTTTDLFT